MTVAGLDYVRYLADKKQVDDGSLNRTVQLRILNWIEGHQAEAKPLRILEVGAGIGTMLERLLEAVPPRHWIYTGVEREPRFREVARRRLQAWSEARGRCFTAQSHSRWRLQSGHGLVEVDWRCEDLLKTGKTGQPGSFDLLIAHAVIDLLPVPACLPELLACLGDRGAYYFSLNYGGETEFQPAHPLDEIILDAYHGDMDRRFQAIGWRASRTGLLLDRWLAEHDYPVLAKGPSDWNLGSTRGRNPATDRFIGHILDTIEQALADHASLTEWLPARREQLAAGNLGYRAVNRDYFGQRREMTRHERDAYEQ